MSYYPEVFVLHLPRELRVQSKSYIWLRPAVPVIIGYPSQAPGRSQFLRNGLGFVVVEEVHIGTVSPSTYMRSVTHIYYIFFR